MDHATVSISQKIVGDSKVYNEYAAMEKYFILLPMEHQENKNLTRKCVTEFFKLDKDVEAKLPDVYKSGLGKFLQLGLKFAQDHDATIQKFGRYPHRNEVLGRESTPAELECLESADRYG